MSEADDPYQKLRERLQQQQWPGVFMFKFIVTPEKVEDVKQIFGPAEIKTRQSRNGNYVSITGKEMMMDSETVIDRYKEAAKIEGLIAL